MRCVTLKRTKGSRPSIDLGSQISNFIVQRDNALNLELAKSSRKIAEESRIDNLLNVKLAKVTAQMAEETRQDSAAMKTIATLTLIFLPGTAVAVSMVRTDVEGSVADPNAEFFRHGWHVQLVSERRRAHCVAVRLRLLRGDCAPDADGICGMVVVVPQDGKGAQGECSGLGL